MEESFFTALQAHGPLALILAGVLWAGYRLADKLLEKLVHGLLAAAHDLSNQINHQATALDKLSAHYERIVEQSGTIRDVSERLREQELVLRTISQRLDRLLKSQPQPKGPRQ